MRHWILCGALSLALVQAACGGPQGLPPPPDYQPTASPEPETACPVQRTAAQERREALLELQTPAARRAAVDAVMVHAECEAAAFDSAIVEGQSQEQLIERTRAARLRYLDARNLYVEIANYQVLALTIGSRSRLGDLHSAFASKLRDAPAPADLRDPAERASFLTQLGDYAQAYDADALLAYRASLEAAALLPGLRDQPDVARWIDAACRGFTRLGAAGEPPAVCAAR